MHERKNMQHILFTSGCKEGSQHQHTEANSVSVSVSLILHCFSSSECIIFTLPAMCNKLYCFIVCARLNVHTTCTISCRNTHTDWPGRVRVRCALRCRSTWPAPAGWRAEGNRSRWHRSLLWNLRSGLTGRTVPSVWTPGTRQREESISSWTGFFKCFIIIFLLTLSNILPWNEAQYTHTHSCLSKVLHFRISNKYRENQKHWKLWTIREWCFLYHMGCYIVNLVFPAWHKYNN